MTATKHIRSGLKSAKKAILGSVEVVTIPASHYSELLAAKALVEKTLCEQRRRFPRSPIDANPAMRTFITERLGKMRIVDIAAECRKEFGCAATSKSSIHRFSTRMYIETLEN